MKTTNQTLSFLSNESLDFPNVTQALNDPNGLLALGGDLSAQRLINAYKYGIFPWYNQGEPIMWWSPDPRAIIPTNDIRINRTLKKVINRHTYQVTINRAFEQVITLCADAPFRNEDTWIIDEMLHAYTQLHQMGYAHSVEVWHNEELVGGLYGVAINGLFSGESMFYRMPNASKVALVSLANVLKAEGISFIDCQITNPFLEDMGCINTPRSNFLSLKQEAINTLLPNNFWQPRSLTII